MTWSAVYAESWPPLRAHGGLSSICSQPSSLPPSLPREQCHTVRKPRGLLVSFSTLGSTSEHLLGSKSFLFIRLLSALPRKHLHALPTSMHHPLSPPTQGPPAPSKATVGHDSFRGGQTTLSQRSPKAIGKHRYLWYDS